MVEVDLFHFHHGCLKLWQVLTPESPSCSMSLEWGNAVVTAGPQAQEQSLPYVHAAEVPAFHSQGVGEDRNLDSEGKVHSSQLLDAYSSLVQHHDEPKRASYAPDWFVVGFPLVDDVHDGEQDTGLTLQGTVEGNAENG
jgi:hypothetical protein